MNYFTTYFIYILILSALLFLSSWKLFKKMGISPLIALIPFYNYYCIAKANNRPKWWIALVYLPVIGVIMLYVFHLDIQKRFGKTSTLQQVLGVLFPFLYLATINYSNTELEAKEEQNETKESFVGSVAYAVVFATLVHLFITQPFAIPTGSMERTMLVGDFLFVNKHTYGYRMPMRPLGLPFLQGTIFDTGKKGNPKDDPKSYIEAVKLPYFRFPGLKKVERNDIVVFNYPGDSVHVAIDRKDSYVKRCIAVAGDVIQLKNGKLLVNHQPEKILADAEQQQSYFVVAGSEIDINQLWKTYGYLPVQSGQNEKGFLYQFQGLTPKVAADIKAMPEVISIEELIAPENEQAISYFNEAKTKLDSTNTCFPVNKTWNPDWYGPLKIPAKGDIVPINQETFAMYQNLIGKYEHQKIEKKGNQFYINNQLATTYKVQQNYYFMMGDNRDASLDSRFFGFVPETHIVGSPMFTWMSLQGVFDEGPFKIRWERMFKASNTGEKDKTSYWYIAVIIMILFFGWDTIMAFFKKKKEDE